MENWLDNFYEEIEEVEVAGIPHAYNKFHQRVKNYFRFSRREGNHITPIQNDLEKFKKLNQRWMQRLQTIPKINK